MGSLYTKNGVPLTVRGDRVFNSRGQNFGYIRGEKVFGLNGRYRGTIVNGRLIYRSTQSAAISGVRAPRVSIPGSARAHRVGTAAWGDEPDISA